MDALSSWRGSMTGRCLVARSGKSAPRATESGWPQWSRTATSLATEPQPERKVQWPASNLARNARLRALLGNGGVEAHDQSRALPDLDNIAAVEKLLGRFDGRRILAMLNGSEQLRRSVLSGLAMSDRRL